ncbi:MAG: ABC transporter permease subunit [Acidimicrobiia bacterium]|nr:ABC transporter permease [Acidimicrobiia bacterium]MBT8247838.1 ABC transporter permease [Acidimicrobiia bacterium]NNL14758.1 ABC transporter permease subunit [Acidimicrobiia bacterium]NNL96830.1 ABC transporter permease subunit [Acidimicrobiia bacterium]
MLATIVTKTFLDRWKGVAIGAVALAVMFFFGMAVYRDIDLAVYTDLPEAMRSIMNIPADADVGALAYGAIYSSYGALTLASLALSMGSASIAGEERKGTMGLLLGNPKSRTHVLVSKATNIVLLSALGAAILWLAGVVVPDLLNVDVTGVYVGALVFHIFVIAVFHGFLAMAVGGWTGKNSLASGVTVGVMVISFFAVGLLPLIDSLKNGVKAFPWYYYNGSDPHVNGIDWGHLAVLFVGIAVLAVVALVGVNRRDLRGQTTRVSLVDRLRANPTTKKMVDRLAGSARVSRIWVKTASENQGILTVVAYVMFVMMGLLIGPLYTFIDETLISLTDAFPEELLAMLGGGDMSTPEGFYQIETFGLMTPIAFMVVTVLIGARALAGEEANRTMGLLLANPIKRSSVVLEKTVAMIVQAAVVAVALFAGVVGGSMIGGLGMSPVNIAAATLLGMLLGLVFGALALAFSAATGRTRVAVYGTIGTALALYLANGFLPFSEGLEGLAKWTPFHYYLSSDPLLNGMNWGHAAVLLSLFGVLVVAAVMLFDRRDLRQSS